ncbi:multidrug efflux transporter AcrB transmembrane domain-containing protein [Meredithblackwellia eburnea MCA 4105]
MRQVQLRILSFAALGFLLSTVSVAAKPPTDPAFIRERGRCAMRGTCGRKGAFGGALPCPDNDLAATSSDPIFLSMLSQICGPDFSPTTCCDISQLQTLMTSLSQAEPLLATCPGCHNNFKNFYCHFTCSPDQSQWMAVTETQEVKTGDEVKTAVKQLEVNIGKTFGQGFFNSCKDVKFGATNGYAMDLIGGGAKNYLSFLRYMGQERALGSPFEITYPDPSPDTAPEEFDSPILSPQFENMTIVPFNNKPLSCSSSDLNARCACLDCPQVCTTLPYLPSPKELASRRCYVGKMSCFAFSLVIIYAVGLVLFVLGLGYVEAAKRKWKASAGAGGAGVGGFHWPRWTRPGRSGYDRVPLEDPNITGAGGGGVLVDSPEPSSPVISTHGSSGGPSRSASGSRSNEPSQQRLVGASSTSQIFDSGRSSLTFPDNQRRRNTDLSLLDPSSDSLASSAGPNPFFQPRIYPLNTYLSRFFFNLGLVVSRAPFLTLAVCFLFCGLANLGWAKFEVEKDPVRLWVAKGSQSALAKEEFDKNFGPFYRTEQIFVYNARPLTSKTVPQGVATEQIVFDEDARPVLSWDRLKWWSTVEADIRSLKSYPNNYTLSDVCFSPQTEPKPPTDSSACVVQSLMGYFADSLEDLSERTWASALDSCATSPATCLPGSGQPMNPKLLLGGIPPSNEEEDGEDSVRVRASEAKALVVTYVVRNSLDKEVVEKAEEWEKSLEGYLKTLAAVDGVAREGWGLEVAYSTGLSLEEELNKSSNTDIPIVVLSYLVMFFYVSLNLGSSGAGLLKSLGKGILALAHGISNLFSLIPVPELIGGRRTRGRSRSGSITLSLAGSTAGLGTYLKRQLFVESKFLLGLWGIAIVLLSVSTSVALCSAAGIRVTLIIAEVIPFLVLAIGVDNVFILSHELDEQNVRAYSSGLRPGNVFSYAEQGDEDLPPAEERVARALGRMGPSILLSCLCEASAFSLGALVGMPAVRNFAIYAAVAVLINTLLQVTIFTSAMSMDLKRIESNRIDCMPCLKLPPDSSMDLSATVSEGLIARFIRTRYAPFLLLKAVKYFVLALFSGLFVLSWIGARHIHLGLDQRLALPADSHLIKYFNALDNYLDVGPPVYFISKGLNVTNRSTQRQLCGRFTTCDSLSLANVLEAERKRPEASFIAEPPAVWLDDFFQWMNPLLEDCCRVRRRDPTLFCAPTDSSAICRPCLEDQEPPWTITLEGLPEGPEFLRYLDQWLASPTDETCPLGGKASYSSAISRENTSVLATHFRTYHTPLKSQSDYINAMASSERIAKELSHRTGGEVVPYSLFYVFFDQYSTISSVARQVLTLALLAVFFVTGGVLGSWRTGGAVILTCFLTVINVLGVMGIWGISLNAISLVNLVISVGIAVEFCSHIARAFMGASAGGIPRQHPASSKDRDERARAALNDVGSSVLSGITFTKLIGISVLALTRSKLLEVYFFRMWLTLIISGALHGLVFLPVALSFLGGQGYALNSEDEDWIGAAVGTRYDHEGRPFMADEDDDDSVDSDRFY